MQIIMSLIRLLINYLAQMAQEPAKAAKGKPLTEIQAMRKVYAENGATMDFVSILGARNDQNPGEWNDFFIVAIGDELFKLKGTTDPGRKYTVAPLNAKGCANICLGFHEKIWQKGFHKGKPALQQCAPIRIWRDANQDHVFDEGEPVYYAPATSGLNYHRGGWSAYVGGWSAGCQVPQDPVKYQAHYELIEDTDQDLFSLMMVQQAALPKQLLNLPYWDGN